MKKFKLKKITVNLLLIISTVMFMPTMANAEWKQDNTGWWYKEGNSWSVGWKFVDGNWYYFKQDGYMKTGWLQDSNKKWYYLNSDGSMAHDTTIDGYTIGSDGAWNQNNSQQSTITQKKLSNIILDSTTISGVTGVNFNDITKIVFYDGRGQNNPITVEDKQKIKEFMGYLNDYSIEKAENPESTGWIHKGVFYVNDKEVMSITFNNPIIINGDYFNIKKGELDTQTISELLK